MSQLTTMPTKKASFWDKPEGLIGMIGAFAAAGGVLWVLSIVVPIILSTFLGILGIMIVGGIIFALSALTFFDNPLRRAIVLKYQITCRKMYTSIIKSDPISVRRIIQSKALKRKEEVLELRAPVKTAKRTVDGSAKKFQDMLENLEAQYNLAKKDGDAEHEQDILAQMGQIQTELEAMIQLSRETAAMDEILDVAIKKVDKIIKKAQFEIDVAETKLKASAAVRNGWTKLRSIFTPNSAEEEMRLEAERASEERLNEDLGEIDRCMSEFKEVLSVMNTQDRINAEKARIKMQGLKQFAAEEPKAISNQPASVANFKPAINKVYTPVRK